MIGHFSLSGDSHPLFRAMYVSRSKQDCFTSQLPRLLYAAMHQEGCLRLKNCLDICPFCWGVCVWVSAKSDMLICTESARTNLGLSQYSYRLWLDHTGIPHLVTLDGIWSPVKLRVRFCAVGKEMCRFVKSTQPRLHGHLGVAMAAAV